MEHAAASFDMHEKEDDEQRLDDRNHEGHHEVKRPEIDVADSPGEPEQDEEDDDEEEQ